MGAKVTLPSSAALKKSIEKAVELKRSDWDNMAKEMGRYARTESPWPSHGKSKTGRRRTGKSKRAWYGQVVSSGPRKAVIAIGNTALSKGGHQYAFRREEGNPNARTANEMRDALRRHVPKAARVMYRKKRMR